jgi:AspBHI-like restriction endonuclease/restriction endonuclease
VTTAVPFDDLATADLVIDRVYGGGVTGNVSDDPLQRLLPVGNQGGFRYKGSLARGDLRVVVLYTSGGEGEWPDRLDSFTGTLIYFGDNRRPGAELHDTRRRGNEMLRAIFERAHEGPAGRATVPPILVFSKGTRGRDVIFQGLAVPGSPAVPAGEDLVALWRMSNGHRFQNYRATFTILDEGHLSREWINDVLAGAPLSTTCPTTWGTWVDRGTYAPLITDRVDLRPRAEQLPKHSTGLGIVSAIHRYFNIELSDPFRFEECAVEIWKMMAPATGRVDITQRWRDGGRDAIGSYLLGPIADRVSVEFALEAKCYAIDNSVGVREMSRLISRLRFRQFGVFVTTSYFHRQAYQEVRIDGHPVVLIAARDIVEALAASGITTVASVNTWLRTSFPK